MRSYVKYILVLSLVILNLDAKGRSVTPTTLDVSAFTYPTDMASINVNYQNLSSSFDLFHLHKDRDEIEKSYGALGDATGVDIHLGYGVNRFFTILYNLDFLNIDYLDDKLKNRRNELVARVNFYDAPYYIMDAFSMDIGFINNSASDVGVGHVAKDAIYSDLDSNTKVDLKDLSDNSYYLRFILGNRFHSSIFNLYAGISYTKIDTTIKRDLRNNLNLIIDTKKEDLDRTEKSLFLGLSYSTEFGNFILDKSIEYRRLYRSGKVSNENNSNLLINLNISRVTHKGLLIYIGGVMMFDNLNGVIPYAYNRYTQKQFDDKYGYLRLGFVYNFDTKSMLYMPSSFDGLK